MQVSVPEFKHFNRQATVDEVVDHLLSLTPNGKWVQDNGQDVHLIITGGEPLLAWQRLYVELFEHERMRDLKMLLLKQIQHKISTLSPRLFREYRKDYSLPWSCSPKLSVSGESGQMLLSLMWLLIIAGYLVATSILKFVVADRTDIEEAGRAVEEYPSAGLECPVYLMPGWQV